MIKELQDVNFKETQDHRFLAEELLIPFLNRSDTTRVNMFTLHLPQASILINPDHPKLFSGYENKIGDYSSGKVVTDNDLLIVKKIVKNKLNYLLLVSNEKEKVLDVIKRTPSVNITEEFGYSVDNSAIDAMVENTIIDTGTVVTKNSYDQYNNFAYGKNLDVVFLPYQDLTYEDGIIIKRSTAESLETTSVIPIQVELNPNDVLVNLLGNKNDYKAFPDIGESVKDGILLSRRRINYSSALYDFNDSNLSSINFLTDQVYYTETGGIVTDIDIYSNVQNLDELNQDYNKQLIGYLKDINRYYQEIIDTVEEYVAKGYTYTEDLAFIYNTALKALNPNVTWRDQHSNFDHMVIRFTVTRIEKIVDGSKLTNRVGGKGVISAIVDDEDMPTRESDGKSPDLLINPFGIYNRQNLTQFYEHEINAMSEIIENRLRDMDEGTTDSMYEMEEYLFSYIESLNPKQASVMRSIYDKLDDENFNIFWDEILHGAGILIEAKPFFGNTSFEELMNTYDKFDINLEQKFSNIEEPLIMGKVYYMVLKHHPRTKFSVRSPQFTNLNDTPSKSLSHSSHHQPYKGTPIRLGEMEFTNMNLTNRSEDLLALNSMYSTNKEDRLLMFSKLLNTNPLKPMYKIPITDTLSKTTSILQTLLSSMKLKIEEVDADEKDLTF